MAIRMEPQGVLQEAKVTWSLPTSNYVVNLKDHPFKVQPGEYVLATGVDGRQPHITKGTGYKTWMDLGAVGGFSFDPDNLTSWLVQGGNRSGLVDVVPFDVPKIESSITTPSGRFYGVVVTRLTHFPQNTDWLTSRVIVKDTTALTEATLFDPYAITPVIWTEPWGSGTEGVTSETFTPAVFTSGRCLYILGDYFARGSKTLWYGLNHNGNASSWHKDSFGVPANYLIETKAFTSTLFPGAGYMLDDAFYMVASRLVDTVRNRYSSIFYKYISVDSPSLEKVGPESAYSAMTTDPANYGIMIVTMTPAPRTLGGLQRSVADEAMVGQINVGAFVWDEADVFCSIGRASPDRPSGPFYLAGRAWTDYAWRAEEATNVCRKLLFRPGVIGYLENNGTDFAVPCTDRSLAISEPLDHDFDNYYSWYELKGAYTACMYKGLSVILTQPTLETSPNVYLPKSDIVYLMWSDPRRRAPENFPVVCNYPTSFTPPVLKPANDWGDNSLEVYPPSMCMVQAAGHLFVFGSGPIIRCTRDSGADVGLAITEIPSSYGITGRYAAASFGAGILFASHTGFYLLDGATSSIVEVEGLSRLLRERWTTERQRASISLAYDEVMDAIYILCGATGDLVIVWLKTNRITMEECTNFAFARSGNIPVSLHTARQRAVLVTLWGRVCYPNDEAPGSGGGQYALHLIRGPDGKELPESVISVPYVARIGMESIQYLGGHQVTGIRLKTDLDGHGMGGPDFNSTSLMRRNNVLTILTGPLAGATYRTAWFDKVDTYGAWWYLLTVNYGDLLDQLVSISALPTTLVGAGLPGQSTKPRLERKHVSTIVPVITRLRGHYAGVPTPHVFRVGALRSEDLLTFEPVPDGEAWQPAFGALPTWVDRTALATRTYAVPAPNGLPHDPEKPYQQHTAVGERQLGVSGHTLLPVFQAGIPGIGFDLLDWYVYGTIYPEEQGS